MDNTHSRRASWAAVACLMLSGWVAVGTTGFAANSPTREALLRSDLNQLVPGTPFEKIFDRWEQTHGANAAPLLLNLAREGSPSGLPRLDEQRRYAALMGAARLGGSPLAPRIGAFLKDSSWMMRSGALKALSALGNPAVAAQTLALVNDRALVVRLQAVETIVQLKPAGTSTALARAVTNRENYNGKKALWVPQRALAALASGVTDVPTESERERSTALKILETELKKPRDPSLANLMRRAIQRIALR